MSGSSVASAEQLRDSVPAPFAADAPLEGDRESFAGRDSSVPLQPATPAQAARLRGIVDAYHDFVWRSLRRLGLEGRNVPSSSRSASLTAR